jgi:hypothetical protein
MLCEILIPSRAATVRTGVATVAAMVRPSIATVAAMSITLSTPRRVVLRVTTVRAGIAAVAAVSVSTPRRVVASYAARKRAAFATVLKCERC